MDFGLVNPTRYYNFTATIQHITWSVKIKVRH
jgi:hypothetical protein